MPELHPAAEPTPARKAARVSGLGRTLVISFGTQFTIALVNVLATPLLLKFMGVEGYGLVAFFLVLQTWVMLCDFGFSPTLARQLSRFRAGALGADEAAGFLAAVETLFIIGGSAVGVGLVLAAPWIGAHWLHRASLSVDELDMSLRLIAVQLLFRWLCGLYQSGLVGLERQNLSNAVIGLFVFVRYTVGVAALILVARTPMVFFVVLSAFTVLEAIVSRVLLARAMPRALARPAWTSVRAQVRLALGLTLATTATTLISQIDRLALSHALPLQAFGLFGLVVQVSAGIALMAPPFIQAFQPRLTTLIAQGRRQDFVHVYRLVLALIMSLAAGLAGTIAVRPEWVIWAWTGRADIAAQLAPVLTLYAAGGGVAVFLFGPYLLQYAQGRVRLHALGNFAAALVWGPAAVWAAFTYGPIGTGIVWLTGNLLYLLIWVPVIHARLLTEEERRGLSLGIWVHGGFLAALLVASRFLLPLGELSRPAALVGLAVTSLTIALIGLAASHEARGFVGHTLARLRERRS